MRVGMPADSKGRGVGRAPETRKALVDPEDAGDGSPHDPTDREVLGHVDRGDGHHHASLDLERRVMSAEQRRRRPESPCIDLWTTALAA